ncbi:MAG TPA: hypothetical protein VFA12_20085 [Stellaceae bacterium]|nr:hypothetical protein [Stellaceae bacterium]
MRLSIKAKAQDSILIGRDTEIRDENGDLIPGLITGYRISCPTADDVITAEIYYSLAGRLDFEDVPAIFWPADEAALNAAAERLGFRVIPE